MSLLDVRNLTYRFPDGTEALKDISFSLDEGQLLVISGKNGSGKTVLLRILNGLMKPSAGKVLIDGISAGEHPAEVRKKLGLVFQQADSQIIGQTVQKDIAFGLENLRLPAEEIDQRTHDAVTRADLQGHVHQRPRTLSGGEKRRLTVASVAVMSPKIIALDEPFTNLDYPGVLQVLRQLLDLKAAGHTIIIVTHDLEKILAHADRLLLMDSGRIAAFGKPEETAGKARSCGVKPVEDPSAQGIRGMTWLRS